ncbi:spore cortex biosynthesis protein YabQ [Ferviditalea candida]|uniref:Spore cortex biosynthesis protein YabQ n=1 Tax=Ferviditalea candida TaxID=3108399 RepID=A0ABU5ZL85_9BACL|nr:spore cortex biosynthesis protein YabQ [Paenibacillaceae bacterium T2]
MSLNVQFITLYMMFASGFVLGALFDLYRVLSAKLSFPRWLIPILDIIYWIAAILIVFRALYISTQGQLRFSVFLGLIAGVSLYFLLLSRWTIRIIVLAIALIQKIVRFIIGLFHWTVIKPLILLYRLVIVIFGFLSAIAIFIFKIMIQLLYPIWKLFAFPLRPLKPYFHWVDGMIRFVKRIIRRFFNK